MPEDSRSEKRAELEASTRRWMIAGLVLMGLLILAFPIYRILYFCRSDYRIRWEGLGVARVLRQTLEDDGGAGPIGVQ